MMQDWHLQRMLERLKGELKVSEEEWTVVKPRVEEVYRLAHTQSSVTVGETEVTVARRTRELRELLETPEAKPEAIKAKLTLLRAAREQVRQELIKARQELRKIMTLRQEAVLVLFGLLD
jgi:chromosome segregation ATPase